ncbi:MAG: RodZ domain-containing protein [Dehalococcoidia bacterium]
MTAAGDLIGGRYRVERDDRAVGALRRLVATDTHLDRPVLAWVSEAAGAEEDALLEVARAAGQLAATPFLRVLDVASDEAGVAVLMESPGPSLARVRGAVEVDARAAALLLDAVERAQDDALVLARIAPHDVFVVDGEVLVDPIALFLPAQRGDAPVALEDLIDLLVQRAQGGAALARALDADAGGIEAARAASAAATAAAGGATYVDDEPTPVFTPPAAIALADRAPEPLPSAPQRAAGHAAMPAAPPEEPSDDLDAPEDPDGPTASLLEPARPRRGALPWRVFIPMYGALAVVVAGVLVFALRSPSTNPPPTPTAAATGATSGPPAVAPAAGHVTVGLAATEDSGVRVTVDGVVQFDGILNAGQRQAWDGTQRIDVWTDKGKTLQLAVNGKDLGPYSPAMGHPDWNRIDFSFWPGFGQ